MHMDNFSNPLEDEKFDSLREALGALTFSLAEELGEKEEQIKDALAASRRDAAKISRLAGYEITCRYAVGQFLDMNNKFSEAGAKILSLHDDPSFLPALMKEAAEQLKTRESDGRLLKSAMVLIPSEITSITLDRTAVARGIKDAIEWLETDLFPLFREMCPPPPVKPRPPSPPQPPWFIP